jgi:protein TonB
MKRKNEKVPGFDEIIFENRNKEYGAYDLRKRYDSATSISILGAVAFSVLLIALFTLSTEEGEAYKGQGPVIIELTDPIIPEPVAPAPAPPEALTKAMQNLAPVVSTDSSEITNLPLTAEELVQTIRNGDPKDSSFYVEPSDPVAPVYKEPQIIVEEMPEYPGGIPELMKYISENIVYPQDAIMNNIQGRVILRFVVNTDGSVDRIQILRGIDASLDNEAIRVVSSLPKFNPGKQQGVPVPVWFSLPVLFRLQN